MKLADHVQHIKNVTYQSFDNLFARLGIRANKLADKDLIPNHRLSKRAKILELIDNHKEEKDDYGEAREHALEELTFTLFNRIAAVKVMEAKTLFPEIITKRAENGDRSFQHKAWLQEQPEMRSEEREGLRDFIKYAFNDLGDELALYHKSYPYALLPNTIDLNEIIAAFNAVEKDKDIEDRIWASDDILGWLYESYNNDKKQQHKDSGEDTEYDKVSLQSQWYTPRWVVEFLVNNSLAKLYLEMYPTSDIKNRKKIANAPQQQLREPKPLHEVTLIDPAPGSGNFLLYAFDLFYELYMDQIEFFGADYEEEEIPQLIIEHNLFGIDLDDRAVQLAQLGLYIKAKSKNRNTSVPGFHVVSSDFYLPDFETVRPLFEDGGVLESGVTDLLKEIWDDLQNAHKFGSLLKIEDRVNRRLKKFKEEPMGLFVQEEITKYGEFEEKFFPRIRKAVQQHANGKTTAFVKEKTLDALTYLDIVTRKYDLSIANPPYTPSDKYGEVLKDFIKDNYKKGLNVYENLYSCFFKRMDEITNSDGYVAMICPMTFMFIDSFKHMREFILKKYLIDVFVHFGFGGIFNVSIDPAFFCLRKKGDLLPKNSTFIKLDDLFNKDKVEIFHEIVEDFNNSHARKYSIDQRKLLEIKSNPYIYWISDTFREKFKSSIVGDNLKVCVGLQTGSNPRFCRFWWELTRDYKFIDKSEKWYPYAKGGAFNKWHGNLWLTVNWENNGQEIKNYTNDMGKQKSRPQNIKYYFKEGITYSASGRGGYAFRHLPKGSIFDVGGSSIFLTNEESSISYVLGLLNSKLCFYIANCLNPTANIQVGDIKRIPYATHNAYEDSVKKISTINISIAELINGYKIFEPNFNNTPFDHEDGKALSDLLREFFAHENMLTSIQLLNKSIIDDLIFDIYELSDDDRVQVLKSEGPSVGNYPVLSEALSTFKDAIQDSDYVTDELWEKLDQIEHDGQVIGKKEKLEKEFSKLYQSNYGFEEFCIENEINPINLWYWFKESGIVPQQRAHDMALEFLADLIREVLMEDEDGMIPLVRNAGEEILIDRLERKMREKGFSTAQISQLDGLLSRPLNEYLQENFFEELSDHLNLFNYFPKTPFIWHLSSGPNKGFECYLVIYKWSRDNLLSLKSVYIEKRERALKNRLTDLSGRSDAASQNERDTIQKQLEEIEAFKDKIDDLIASGYDPILDDGVGKNIAPLQKRGLIPYNVLTKSQLKKYLNADW